jgi:hypothetical protein
MAQILDSLHGFSVATACLFLVQSNRLISASGVQHQNCQLVNIIDHSQNLPRKGNLTVILYRCAIDDIVIALEMLHSLQIENVVMV